ncbi:hypothetical protein BC343_27135 [Mucilaginibacter pedocola]|uniref:Uncharacterized protein n=1 Tax=Mucilaginibacter pedocola TaxID=1792845 RepID=A0A1S9PGH1_9SPHI|nr:hypothetical protein BC343_27135 [Mucilaginibacter pedocola]
MFDKLNLHIIWPFELIKTSDEQVIYFYHPADDGQKVQLVILSLDNTAVRFLNISNDGYFFNYSMLQIPAC